MVRIAVCRLATDGPGGTLAHGRAFLLVARSIWFPALSCFPRGAGCTRYCGWADSSDCSVPRYRKTRRLTQAAKYPALSPETPMVHSALSPSYAGARTAATPSAYFARKIDRLRTSGTGLPGSVMRAAARWIRTPSSRVFCQPIAAPAAAQTNQEPPAPASRPGDRQAADPPVVPYRQRARADRCPDVFQRPLLSHSGFVLERDFHGLARRRAGQCRLHQDAEVALKATSASSPYSGDTATAATGSVPAGAAKCPWSVRNSFTGHRSAASSHKSAHRQRI